MLSDILKNRY